VVSVAVIVGVRPNIVKAAAIVGAMRRRGSVFDIDLIHSGQHVAAEMSDAHFVDVGLEAPHWRISAPPNRTLLSREAQISVMADEIEARLRVKRSRFVLALGDVTTTVAAARAGRRVGATVVHYEGGLRCTFLNMPEERNRREADLLSDVVLTTEESANANLASEPAMRGKEVVFVGNVMIDTIVARRSAARLSGTLAQFDVRRREFVVVTMHRQANVDDPVVLEQVVQMLEACSAAGFKLLLATHPRTSSKIDVAGLRPRLDRLADRGLVNVGALSYVKFLALLDAASAVLTDSGGVQEESSFLGVPCVTLRNDTERPITVDRGTNVLAPIGEPELVVSLLRSQIVKWSNAPPPHIDLWDGRASERMADWFLEAVKRHK
jgi:UDP-N-acetylglucosamine 2-epimerase (non-hydrolysing)